MIYIYDILLNFNNNFYEFYEWEKNDYIYHVKKIPLFKTNTSFMELLLNKKIKMSEEFANLISCKVDLFGSKKNKLLKYACLLTDGYKVIGIELNENFEISRVSDLLLDEANDTIELSSRCKEIKFLMSSDFSNNDSYFQEKYKEYLKTKRYFSFLTDSMDKYLETIENDGTLKSEMKIAFIKKYVMEGIKAKDFIKNYANGHSSYFYRTKYEVVKEIIPILWGNDESKLYKIFLEKI